MLTEKYKERSVEKDEGGRMKGANRLWRWNSVAHDTFTFREFSKRRNQRVVRFVFLANVLSRVFEGSHHPTLGPRTPTARRVLRSSSPGLTLRFPSFRSSVLCPKGSSPDPCRRPLPCS